MATAYDTWLEGNCGIDEAEEARAERVDERAAELFRERIANEDRVRDALSFFFTVAADDCLENALARFYVDFDAAKTDARMADAALALFRALQPQVEGDLRDEANADAEREEVIAQREADDARAEAAFDRAHAA